MTQTQLKTLLKLSRKEKIELVQTLWEDVASGENKEKISDDHREKLEKTLKNISSGKTKFKNWSEIRKNFLNE